MSNFRKYIIFAGFLSIFGAKTANAADPIQFIYPVSCTYGQDCWAVNYVDTDTAEGSAKDFKCNTKTYDDHKGTDFALSSITQMNKGIDVLAAAEGIVERVRDGENDTLKSESELADIKNNTKECGNGVLISHGNGIKTIYCHMRKDSIVVKPQQKIKAGEKLGQVGQSGMAEFPHLHFGVMQENNILDPFTGAYASDGCGQMKQSLWHVGLPVHYEPVVIFDGGFRAGPPDFEAIKRGEENPQNLSLSSAAFVFWTGFYNVEKDDQITLAVRDPDGNSFVERKHVQDENRARQYYFAGRKIGNVQLRNGTYTGQATLIRQKEGEETITRTKEFSIIVQ